MTRDELIAQIGELGMQLEADFLAASVVLSALAGALRNDLESELARRAAAFSREALRSLDRERGATGIQRGMPGKD